MIMFGEKYGDSVRLVELFQLSVVAIPTMSQLKLLAQFRALFDADINSPTSVLPPFNGITSSISPFSWKTERVELFKMFPVEISC
jgi:hypothetical protein